MMRVGVGVWIFAISCEMFQGLDRIPCQLLQTNLVIRASWSLKSETPGEAFTCPGDLTVRGRLQAVTRLGS